MRRKSEDKSCDGKGTDKAKEGGLSLSEGRERGKIVLLKDGSGGGGWGNVEKKQCKETSTIQNVL